MRCRFQACTRQCACRKLTLSRCRNWSGMCSDFTRGMDYVGTTAAHFASRVVVPAAAPAVRFAEPARAPQPGLRRTATLGCANRSEQSKRNAPGRLLLMHIMDPGSITL